MQKQIGIKVMGRGRREKEHHYLKQWGEELKSVYQDNSSEA
jgi:hypothetical protein